ncbi:MAG: hypothetical protein E7043_09525 [Lentisphaerae bacterium]|nr:hypothetical protein [Lentisphaerota bacterium]
MTWTAFFLIIASAVMHASWNLLAKKYHITLPFYTIICSTAMAMWLHVQLWTPVDVWNLPVKFWLSLAGSVSSDVLYCCGLVMAYRFLDMSSAYPMMRSLPILLTLAVTSLAGIGKELSWLAIGGGILVFAGCMSMPLKSFSDFNWRRYLNKSMFFVLVTACGTTGYTIFDKLSQDFVNQSVAGENISRIVLSVTYYSTRGIVLSSTLLLLSLIIPGQRKYYRDIWQNYRFMPVLAGVFASVTYVLVLISMNFVDNVSYVQVFRQTGLIFGVLAGIFFLKEKACVTKFAGVILIIAGLILSVI